MGSTLFTVRQVDHSKKDDLENFKSMTMRYLEWLGEDLCFQGIDDELESLPGAYGSLRGGTMLLAVENSTQQCIGAVALRALEGKQTEGLTEILDIPVNKICEMKRLFVIPEQHGTGIGKELALAVLAEAQRLGYQAMVLDTLQRLTGANRLYQTLGFEPCDPYNFCPLEGVLYWMKKL